PIGWHTNEKVALDESARGLASQFGHILRGKLGRLTSETPSDIVGHRRDLDIRVSVPEARHRYDALRGRPVRAGYDDLSDVGGASAVPAAGAGDGAVRANRAPPRPAVTAGAGTLEHPLADRVHHALTVLGSSRCRRRQRRRQVGRHDRGYAPEVRDDRA